MVRGNRHIAIEEREIEESFIRASGPGGQNVNKVATAVELRFDIAALPDGVRMRLAHLAGRRLTKEGVLVLRGARFRTQERNREDVRERLVELIRRAAATPRPRRATKPSRAVKERRLEAKKSHSRLKRLRSKQVD